MFENPVLSKWRQGKVTLGAWLSIPSAVAAEVVAHSGYEWICIDMQHGLVDYQEALSMIQAIDGAGGVPFARVPGNDANIIGKVLDAGALGIIIPMVNSRREAEQAVAACRYHPEGRRSYGPLRASYRRVGDYYEQANHQIACIPMIETSEAVSSLDEIVSTPGVDAVYVGPADLSITLGEAPRLDNAGRFEEARQKIAAACRNHDVVAGIHATAALARKHADAGYQIFTVSGDVPALMSGLRRDWKSASEALAQSSGPHDA